jgi:hypothetical protein
MAENCACFSFVPATSEMKKGMHLYRSTMSSATSYDRVKLTCREEREKGEMAGLMGVASASACEGEGDGMSVK